jgi:hypothetical protein
MKGYDEIALTLKREDDVGAFEKERPSFMDPAVPAA